MIYMYMYEEKDRKEYSTLYVDVKTSYKQIFE